MRKLLTIILLSIFLISFVSAVCTVTLDKEIYNSQATVTATMLCDNKNEDNDAYTLNWTNSSRYVLETDTGFAPKHDNAFFDTYTLPANYNDTYGDYINATLNGVPSPGDLEGTDFANVTGDNAYSLIINHTHFSPFAFIGNLFSLNYNVKDVNGKLVSNAKCFTFGTDESNSPLATCGESVSLNGRGVCSDVLANIFDEGEQYIVRTRCSCGTGDNACFDEDGNSVNLSTGSTTTSFTTNTWLTVNTVTDKSNYFMKNEIIICANITNVDKTYRIPLHINHQIRCSAGADNYGDLDRTLIISDGEEHDVRGIDNGTTQMQCKRFQIPESRYLQGKSSECYASTTVFVIGKEHQEIMNYATSSPVFNITSDELNINPDWQRTSDYNWNTIVNLSTDNYGDFNGIGTGNIDLKLNMIPNSIDTTDQYGTKSIQIEDFIMTQYIKNIIAKNSSGENISYNFEMLDDGSIEIELINVDISSTGWFNVTLEFNQFLERQADALEGIENKTGTFHLDIDCPSSGTIGSDMNCIITAYLEDPQAVQKEVDFTCYISDGTYQYSSLNFNQMITKTPLSMTRTFSVPSSFTDETSYVLQCHADYYNLGSRRDSFYDTFTASTSPPGGGGPSGGSGITGGVVDEEDEDDKEGILKKIEDIIKKINPFNPETNPLVLIIEGGILFLIIGFLILCILRKRKQPPRQRTDIKETLQKIFKPIFILVGISAIIALIAYLYKKIKNISINTSFIQDPLIRDLILIGAIVGFAIILFKSLHIRGEIQFGRDPHRPRFNQDKTTSRLQRKINRHTLKHELRRKKHTKHPVIRKVRIKRK